MNATITTSTEKDNEGCLIATARRGAIVCHYDGDDYSGNGSNDDDLRSSAKSAYTCALK